VLRLFEGDDPDICAWARGTLIAVDTKWAGASPSRLIDDLKVDPSLKRIVTRR
jgi:hypothetical protein